MILNDVAHSAGLIVKSATALDTEVLGHRDLDAFDIVSIPEGLHECVCKPEDHDVAHGPFAQIVIDSKDGGLRKNLMQAGVQLAGGSEIMAEGLLYNDAGPFGAASIRQLFHNSFKQKWRDGQIKRRLLRVLEF